MITAIFKWFETRNDPFPRWQPDKPPATLGGFVLHYTWSFRWLIVAASVLAATIAILEVYLFSIVGSLVDWLAAADRASFWSDHAAWLIAVSVLVLLVLPVLKFFYEVAVHQGLLGNFWLY